MSNIITQTLSYTDSQGVTYKAIFAIRVMPRKPCLRFWWHLNGGV